jgi:hypothetical protein
MASAISSSFLLRRDGFRMTARSLARRWAPTTSSCWSASPRGVSSTTRTIMTLHRPFIAAVNTSDTIGIYKTRNSNNNTAIILQRSWFSTYPAHEVVGLPALSPVSWFCLFFVRSEACHSGYLFLFSSVILTTQFFSILDWVRTLSLYCCVYLDYGGWNDRKLE